MNAVGTMLMWLVGIVFFPIVVYIVWKIYKYMRTLPIKMQQVIVILTIVTPLILYIGMTHITDKGYCIRDGKYFSEYSQEEMIDNAIVLLQSNKLGFPLEEYRKFQDFSKKSMFENIEEFKSFNDDCCHVHIGDVDDGRGSVRYFYKLTGKFYGYVKLEYWQIRPNTRMTEEQGSIYRKVAKEEQYYGVSRCGDVFEIPDYLYF